MKEFRILFTGVGRRIELISAFREAALSLDVKLKIYGADLTGTAPALAYCDFTRKVCSMKDSNYINELLDICREDQIDLLIPTIDTDLLILSKHASAFLPTKVLISAPDKILLCRDKNHTSAFFEDCGCLAPKTYNDWTTYDGIYPCFIKPKDGSSSINAFKVEAAEELKQYSQQINDYIIQPFIDGTEYTVDIFCDFDSQPIYIVPRIRLQVRAGEVLKTQIALDQKIINECKRIISKFNPVGPITVQLIRQHSTGDDYFIEINPRFGGGAPLSMKAGAKSAVSLLKLMLGEKPQYQTNISDGAVYSRFDQSVCIQEGVPQKVQGIIFDLDDTLYDERQYVASGFQAIADFLKKEDAVEKLWKYFDAGLPAIDMYLREIGETLQKENCLKVYREHRPTLSLNRGISELLIWLKSQGIKIGIITDGRPDGQRNKIVALGLDQLIDDIIITDELGGEQFRKPCDIAFRIMQRRWKIPFERLLYIGDNFTKDFQAAKGLGMQWKWFLNPRGLYYSPNQAFSDDHAILSLDSTCFSDII